MKSNRYICIFGGGAIRGVAYPGAIKALEELEIEIPVYVGSSVGAIFATLAAFGYKSDELLAIIQKFNAFIFKDINFSFGDFSISKGEIFEEWIKEKLGEIYYNKNYEKGKNPPIRFKDLDKDLYILATDIRKNERFVFSKYTTPDYEIAKAVRISASFPGLMKPEEYNDKLLVDGDLAKSIPLWEYCGNIINSNCRILEFRLEGNSLNMQSLVDYINTVYGSMSYFCTKNLENIYQNKDKFDYIPIDTKDVLLFDFQMNTERKNQLSELGYNTTKEYFIKTLYEKKKILLPLYKELLEILNKINRYLFCNNFEMLKNSILQYFSEFKNRAQNLDEVLLKETDNFITDLLKDEKRDYFGLKKSIKNKKIHQKSLNILVNKTQFYINDFIEYIDFIDKKYSSSNKI